MNPFQFSLGEIISRVVDQIEKENPEHVRELQSRPMSRKDFIAKAEMAARICGSPMPMEFVRMFSKRMDFPMNMVEAINILSKGWHNQLKKWEEEGK